MKQRSQWLFNGECGDTRTDVIRRWEKRRLDFNAAVGVVGMVSWLLAGGAAVKPGLDFEEPIAMIVGPVFYVIVANVCYTWGWIVHLVAFSGAPRKGLFRAGFIFSVALTGLPGVWAVIAYLITVYTGRKLD